MMLDDWIIIMYIRTLAYETHIRNYRAYDNGQSSDI